jgi:hypothetical protein
MNLSFKARTFITLVVVLGLCVFGNAVANAGAGAIHPARLAAFLAVACVAARLKVKLPGLTGSMAVNLPFILIAAVMTETTILEALVVACISNLVHCLPRAGQGFNVLRTVFNVCNMALAVEATRLVFTWPAMAGWVASPSLRVGVAAAAFFLVNTVPVAIVIALTEGAAGSGSSGGFFSTWLGISQLTFPYFLASAGVAAAVLAAATHVGWLVPALVLPVMIAFYWSYRKIFSPSRLGSDTLRKSVQSQGMGERSGAALA